MKTEHSSHPIARAHENFGGSRDVASRAEPPPVRLQPRPDLTRRYGGEQPSSRAGKGRIGRHKGFRLRGHGGVRLPTVSHCFP